MAMDERNLTTYNNVSSNILIFIICLLIACNSKEMANQSNQKNFGEKIEDVAMVTSKSNETGSFTPVTTFEHGDVGRSHRFDKAIFGGDIIDGSNNEVHIRTAQALYPGAYNMVTRSPEELYIYFGVYGEVEAAKGPTVARLNAHTLEEVWRTTVKEFSPEEWNYPGVLSLHDNGNLYLVGGNIIASLDPETGKVIKSANLPTANAKNSSYNGFVSTSDGTIFVKPLYRSCDKKGGMALLKCPDSETPSVLSAIDPNSLEVIAQVEVSESVFGRLIVGTHEGKDFVYMQGIKSLFRYHWDGTSLALDENWGPIRVIKDGQVGTASPSITEDWLFFQTNGLPSSTTPMTVWAISTQNAELRYSIEPFSDLTKGQSFNVSMGAFDPENERIYVADTGVGYIAALSFDKSKGLETLWRKAQTTLSYTMLVNSVNQRVFVASDLTGLGSRVNPFLAQKEQVVFRNATTGLELARSDKLVRMNSGANLVAGFDGRFYFLGKDSKISELSISRVNKQ